MTLFEDIVEPFDDLSQWSVVGTVGTDPYVAGGNLFFPVHNGEAYDRAILLGDHTLTNSWFSFRVKAVGSYTQGIIGNVGLTSHTMLILNDYPGHTGLSFNLGSDLVTIAADSQPIVAISADDTTVTFAYSLDEGVTWITLFTRTLAESTVDGDTGFKFGCYEVSPASEDFYMEYSDINQFNPNATPVPVSTYLRHSSRMVHKSVFEYMKSALADLNWNAGSSQPFNATKVYMQEELPEEWDGTGVLTPGTVAVTLGDEPAALNEEVGGPLASISFPVFIDCFQDTDGITLALADDVRDILCGRLPNTSRFLQVTNWAVPENATGYQLEFEDVVRERVRNKWHVVKATAVLYFPDAEL